jgi:hypothetical protein
MLQDQVSLDEEAWDRGFFSASVHLPISSVSICLAFIGVFACGFRSCRFHARNDGSGSIFIPLGAGVFSDYLAPAAARHTRESPSASADATVFPAAPSLFAEEESRAPDW